MQIHSNRSPYILIEAHPWRICRICPLFLERRHINVLIHEQGSVQSKSLLHRGGGRKLHISKRVNSGGNPFRVDESHFSNFTDLTRGLGIGEETREGIIGEEKEYVKKGRGEKNERK